MPDYDVEEREKELGIRPRFIYAVRDPRDGLFFYMGIARYPWRGIRDLFWDNNPRFKDAHYGAALQARCSELIEAYPFGFEILTRIVIDKYVALIHGEEPPSYPSEHPYRKRIDWEVLGVQFNMGYLCWADGFDNGKLPRYEINGRWTFNYWYERLRMEGHPIINSPRPVRFGK